MTGSSRIGPPPRPLEFLSSGQGKRMCCTTYFTASILAPFDIPSLRNLSHSKQDAHGDLVEASWDTKRGNADSRTRRCTSEARPEPVVDGLSTPLHPLGEQGRARFCTAWWNIKLAVRICCAIRICVGSNSSSRWHGSKVGSNSR